MAGGEGEGVTRPDRERLGAILELVFHGAAHYEPGVAVEAPVFAPGSGRVLDERSAATCDMHLPGAYSENVVRPAQLSKPDARIVRGEARRWFVCPHEPGKYHGRRPEASRA